MSADKKYPPAWPHDKVLDKVSDDVFCAHGSFRAAPGMRVSNTMTIVRRGTDLTIINSIRVSPALEEEIKKLGTVKYIVRLSSNHGASDEYWVDTTGAEYWDLPGAATTPKASPAPATNNILKDGGELPGIPGSKFILVKNLKMPDGLALLPDGNGILCTVDFIQHGVKTDNETLAFGVMGKAFGFKTGALTTPSPFFKFYGKGECVYVNVPVVLALDFDTVIPAHGPVVRGTGKKELKYGWERKGPRKSKMWNCPCPPADTPAP